MNVKAPVIAMMRYDSFWDGFFSLDTFSFIFFTASIAAFVVAVYRIVQSSSHHIRVRRTLAFVCFLPFVFCVAAALCDLSRLSWDWRSYYPSLWASNSAHMALFGAALTLIATVFYILNRKQPSAPTRSTNPTKC